LGDHYEVEGSLVRKYYSAGGQRIAMREDGALYWLMTDHLGSTAATVTETGMLASELRYKAFGETRYAAGEVASSFRYTGQREESDIGLYYYRARWYDPALGRFTSADSTVPQVNNPQSLNRYAYVINNPLRYIDPSGHTYLCDEECDKGNWSPSLKQYGITLSGGWKASDISVIQQEVAVIAAALAGICGETCFGMPDHQVFSQVFGSMTFTLLDNGATGTGCAAGGGFECDEGARGRLAEDTQRGLVTHELGHNFDHSIDAWGYGRTMLSQTTIVDANGNYVEGIPFGGGAWARTDAGYRSDWFPDQQHPRRLDNLGQTAGEGFADMFMNWVQNSFANDPAGQARHNWMTVHMAEWVPKAMQP